jgi:acyl transferase domain-containing protein
MGPSRAVSETAVAVVGLSCRLPNAPNPDAFWQLLRAGRDVITRGPADRWDCDDQVDLFDPVFFGVSPREAMMMDPRQRLMLELVWEALEDAGTVPGSLRDSATGVFVGATGDDYATLLHRARGGDAITGHTVTGLSRGVIANRVSHTLGLHGPSVTVDTGQSSSLVAVHLASESLRRGESEVAIVVLRRAWQHSTADPAQVQYVELHGTGTAVGDPIEAAALGAVFGGVRPDGVPLSVGSVRYAAGPDRGPSPTGHCWPGSARSASAAPIAMSWWPRRRPVPRDNVGYGRRAGCRVAGIGAQRRRIAGAGRAVAGTPDRPP